MENLYERLDEIKASLEEITGRLSFDANLYHEEDNPENRVGWELASVMVHLDRAMNNVEQDYDVLVTVVTTVQVRAHDEVGAESQAIDRVEDLLASSGYLCDIDRASAQLAIK